MSDASATLVTGFGEVMHDAVFALILLRENTSTLASTNMRCTALCAGPAPSSGAPRRPTQCPLTSHGSIKQSSHTHDRPRIHLGRQVRHKPNLTRTTPVSIAAARLAFSRSISRLLSLSLSPLYPKAKTTSSTAPRHPDSKKKQERRHARARETGGARPSLSVSRLS